jgi:hypothetical protein
MPGQKTSRGTGLRICPPPPAGFDPFAASRVDLARHGLPLRPDPQTQPDLAALWERLADRYRDFEHLEPRPDTATASKKAARETAAPSLLPLDPQESCGYSLFGSQATPFTALFATWTVPDLRYSQDPYTPVNSFRTFVSLGFLDLHTEMSVDSAQHITCGLWAQDVGTINLPVSPGDVVSGSLCLDTKPPGTAHYFLANQTTGQTMNFTVGHRVPARRHRRGRRLPRRLGPPQPRARPLRGRLLRRDQRLQHQRAPAIPREQRRRHDGRPERHHPRPARHAHRLRLQDHLRRSLTRADYRAVAGADRMREILPWQSPANRGGLAVTARGPEFGP